MCVCVCVWMIRSFLSISRTREEAVNEDLAHLINNYQVRVTDSSPEAEGMEGKDGRRASVQTNVCRFPATRTSQRCPCFLVIPCQMTGMSG